MTRRFTSGLHRTLRARAAYSAVATVSSDAADAMPTVAKMHVLLFPPSASRNKRVSFESRYGTCASLSTKAVTTRPSVSKLLLISPASRLRAVAPRSATPLFPTFSEPARSTRFSFPSLIRSSPSSPATRLGCRLRVATENTEWLREECALHLVAAFFLRALPARASASASAKQDTSTSVRPSTETPPRPSSIKRCVFLADADSIVVSEDSDLLSDSDLLLSTPLESKSVISSLYSSRNVHRTEYSVSLCVSRWRKICRNARGTMPAVSATSSHEPSRESSDDASSPSMVCVLPVPVCPYANTVQLNPSSVSATMGSIACAYTSACVASGPNTPSNVYVLDAACAAPVVAPGFPPETALACEDAPGPLAGSGVATTISRRDGFAVTATAALEARSAAFRGLRVGRGQGRVGRSAVGQSRTFRDAALGETGSAVREETE